MYIGGMYGDTVLQECQEIVEMNLKSGINFMFPLFSWENLCFGHPTFIWIQNSFGLPILN